VWLSGVVALLIRWCLARRKLARLTASLVPYGIDAETSEVIRQATGLSRLPPILASREIPVPVVIGHRRPVVAIPEALARSGDRTALRDVLIHECAHVARRDPWVHLVQRCAAVLYWPHPGVHGVNAIISRSREEICDNHVLTASQPVEFARTLLEMSERLVGVRMVPAPLGLLGTRWSLESRVEGLLDPRRKVTTRTRPSGLVAVAVLFALLAAVLGGVRRSEADPPVAKPAAQTATDKNERVTRKSIAVKGRVVLDGKPGKGGEGVEVKAFAFADGAWTVSAKGTTDAEGYFALPELPIPSGSAKPVMPVIVARREGKETSVKYVCDEDLQQLGQSEPLVLDLTLGENPGELTGTVVDGSGRPVSGADVFVPNTAGVPIPGMFSAKTDKAGRFKIDGLKVRNSVHTEALDPESDTGQITNLSPIQVNHPDFAETTGWYSAVPQDIRVTMETAAIVRGVVVDEVTGKPAALALVQAQGVVRYDWKETRTDLDGRFQLALRRDHYNIWAVVDERMPIAVRALPVEPDQETPDVQVRMVRGGVVTGRVLNKSGEPLSVDGRGRVRVAHYGPARPRVGANVSSVLVAMDGTYRLPVAPGTNLVYVMNFSASSRVVVGDGEELKLDLVAGRHAEEVPDPDAEYFRRLRRLEFEERYAEQERSRFGGRKATFNRGEALRHLFVDERRAEENERLGIPKPVAALNRERADTPVGRMLNRLETQNSGRSQFTDKWLRTLKEIVDLGPDAVPELIAELDATSNDMMLRCLGFTLRAIGDKRAIPALIRAIPKTLLPPGSDMGLRAEDAELLKFAQQHDRDPSNREKQYSFGRPVNEVFGALHQLAGVNFDDDRLRHTFDGGSERHRYLKRRLFHNQAVAWETWWKANGPKLVDDVAYHAVNLPAPPVAPPVPPVLDDVIRAAKIQTSNPVLSPANGTLPYAWEFYDLDTGRAAMLPKRFHGHEDSADVRQWAIDEGFDLMGARLPADGDAPAVHVIRPLGLIECRELGDAWWKKEPKGVTLKELRDQSRPAGEFLVRRDPDTGKIDAKGTATYLFVTTEGTVGLVYVGVDVQDDTQKPGLGTEGDNELNPVAFRKGRRFAPSWLVENGAKDD
jgi:5-hydroxyisourate hydrolase-like protein (transthyretin family)